MWHGYFQALMTRLLGADRDLAAPWSRAAPVSGDPRLAAYRLGQRVLQAVVLDAYDRRCAVTGDKIQPLLRTGRAGGPRPQPVDLGAGGSKRRDSPRGPGSQPGAGQRPQRPCEWDLNGLRLRLEGAPGWKQVRVA